MIKNKCARIELNIVGGYQVSFMSIGRGEIKVSLKNSFLMNELRTLDHYLNQELKTEEALDTIREILASDFINDKTKVRITKELLEWINR